MIDKKTRKRKPTHPGTILKELYINGANLTLSECAEKLGISRKTLSKIVNCRSSITPEMACRLSKLFNTSPELWLNLQNGYDIWVMENEENQWQTEVEPLKVIS